MIKSLFPYLAILIAISALKVCTSRIAKSNELKLEEYYGFYFEEQFRKYVEHRDEYNLMNRSLQVEFSQFPMIQEYLKNNSVNDDHISTYARFQDLYQIFLVNELLAQDTFSESFDKYPLLLTNTVKEERARKYILEIFEERKREKLPNHKKNKVQGLPSGIFENDSTIIVVLRPFEYYGLDDFDTCVSIPDSFIISTNPFSAGTNFNYVSCTYSIRSNDTRTVNIF